MPKLPRPDINRITTHAYGFEWGAVNIRRLYSDERYGVSLDLSTPRRTLEIRVTPTGLIRVSESKTITKQDRQQVRGEQLHFEGINP